MDYHDSTLFQAVDRAREETTTYSKLIVRVLLGLVSAVEYVLSQGVLHMDLKEDNVLVNNEGEPVVIDFSHCVVYEASKDQTNRTLRLATHIIAHQS